ncbi:BrnT family toxin [Mesorhizobium sp. CGMCC 1.15528]|uniref:BrnT family toxin n=1 Tax=Mesorhizobium zhangyense TaxID=1776730 RepID=A0A7C9R7S4_9HYPH|nr:BrnT family toxin [Mesorhizobium zhangyense]
MATLDPSDRTTVVYTERGERIRLISARKAKRREQRTYDQERQG